MSALLRGSVNPNMRATDYFFEWGATASYGSVTPTQALPAGNAAVDVSASLSGLATGGTYHYRLVAINVAGTALGGDQGFVAQSGTGGGATAPPTVGTGSTTGVEMTEATLQGSVNPNGGMTTAQFEYGLTNSYGGNTALQDAGSRGLDRQCGCSRNRADACDDISLPDGGDEFARDETRY